MLNWLPFDSLSARLRAEELAQGQLV
jgi:hypothetical protein